LFIILELPQLWGVNLLFSFLLRDNFYVIRVLLAIAILSSAIIESIVFGVDATVSGFLFTRVSELPIANFLVAGYRN